MADLTVSKGDYGFYLNFTILDSDGSAFDLTDYTITLKVWDATPSLIVSGACDIVVAGSGTCKYLIQDGDFDTVGHYGMELELTKTGVKLSTRKYDLEIKSSL